MALRGMGSGNVGMQFLVVYTVFGDFEALALDSRSLISYPIDKNAYEIDLQISDRTRSGMTQLGVFWEHK